MSYIIDPPATGVSAGSWALTSTETVAAGGADVVTMTLDTAGQSSGGFKIEAKIINTEYDVGTATYTGSFVDSGGDAWTTNTRQWMKSSGTAVTAGQTDATTIANAGDSDLTTNETELTLIVAFPDDTLTGNIKVYSTYRNFTGSGIILVENHYNVTAWGGSTGEITGFSINTAQSKAIGEGSVIKLFERNL